VDAGPAPDGTPCGDSQVCAGGTCGGGYASYGDYFGRADDMVSAFSCAAQDMYGLWTEATCVRDRDGWGSAFRKCILGSTHASGCELQGCVPVTVAAKAIDRLCGGFDEDAVSDWGQCLDGGQPCKADGYCCSNKCDPTGHCQAAGPNAPDCPVSAPSSGINDCFARSNAVGFCSCAASRVCVYSDAYAQPGHSVACFR
jgi:hypothetical protein